MPRTLIPSRAAERPLQDLKTHADHDSDRRWRIGAIVAASSGNLVEWFDFYIYAFCALYFAPAFFPKVDPTAQLLNTAGVFAAGFLMRPLGGWLFGRLADRTGRRASLVVSVSLMFAGALMIACLPTYTQIGAWAPGLLLVARLLQGLSVGGDYGTTATYMSEVSIQGRRGFYSSFQYVTLIGGQLLATLVLVLLQQALGDVQLKAWGWRVPFAIGALTAIGALVLRLNLTETTSSQTRAQDSAGSVKELMRHHKANFFTVLGYTAGGSLMFYTFTTYMQKFLVNTVGMPVQTATLVMTFCLLLFMCMQPLFGALSDRIGRRSNMLLFGTLGTVCVVPIMLTLQAIANPLIAGVLITVALAIVSLYTSISGIVKAEMFPTQIRALGVGFAYALANALFGGSAEYVALALKSAGHQNSFYGYVVAIMVVTLYASWRLPRRGGYLQD